MLDWLWKLTRQPACSPASAVVTTISPGSWDDTTALKGSPVTAAPLVPEEQRVTVAQDVAQGEASQRRAGRGDRHRQGVPAHQRRDGEAELVEQAGRHDLAQPGRPALAQH